MFHTHFVGVMWKIIAIMLCLSFPAVAETQVGEASWYGPGFIGHKTSNGELYTGKELTAANNSFPMDSSVQVTNLETHRSVVVRINDRGRFTKKYHRVIDLSPAAAKILNMKKSGIAKVRIQLTKNDE